MFTQDGTFTPGLARLHRARSRSPSPATATRAGTYDVQISRSAAQATDTGAVLAVGVGGGRRAADGVDGQRTRPSTAPRRESP